MLQVINKLVHVSKYIAYTQFSSVTQLYPTLCNPMDCSLIGSFIHGIFRQYQSGLPFPSPGDLPNPGIEPGSPAL